MPTMSRQEKSQSLGFGASVACLQCRNIATEEIPKPGLCRMTSIRVLCSAEYYRQHCKLQAFEQFEALYICTTTMKKKSVPTRIETWYLHVTSLS